MKEEVRVFFTALMFYTRIPCPVWVDHSADYINKCTRYFPLIGWIVGGGAAVSLISGLFLFPVSVAVLLSMVVSVLMTGAFHEDGFADVCDGFGGGWTREKILEIMKDSRVGAYGIIGMVLLLLLKLFLTVEIAHLFHASMTALLLVIVSSHSLSRFFASTFIATHPYVRETETSKVKPVSKEFPFGSLYTAGLFGLVPFAGLVYITGSYLLLLTLVPVWVAKIYLGKYYTKWIGGYTGDCLGAAQQVMEVIFLAAIAGLWTYI